MRAGATRPARRGDETKGVGTEGDRKTSPAKTARNAGARKCSRARIVERAHGIRGRTSVFWAGVRCATAGCGDPALHQSAIPAPHSKPKRFKQEATGLVTTGGQVRAVTLGQDPPTAGQTFRRVAGLAWYEKSNVRFLFPLGPSRLQPNNTPSPMRHFLSATFLCHVAPFRRRTSMRCEFAKIFSFLVRSEPNVVFRSFA